MPFSFQQTPEFQAQLAALQASQTRADQAVLKAALKALAYLAHNPRHPSLHTHKFSSLKGPRGEEVFEAHAQNHTPGAWRIFWCYGPGPGFITLVALTPHP